MYSTWVDNDHKSASTHRIDSSSKKLPNNRIQVVSKINPPLDRPQPSSFYQPEQFPQPLSQTCSQQPLKVVFRRANTTEGIVQKDERDRNLMKLMQEQLELVKASYEQKIKDQLKQSSIELSKLKIKIQNNHQLILSKDQLIQQLKNQNSHHPSPSKTNDLLLPSSANLMNKIHDIQNKCTSLITNQNKLSKKITDIGMKVQCVQKGLLGIFSCKMFKFQMKVNDYIQKSAQKLYNIEIALTNNIKKQVGVGFSDGKSQQLPMNIQSVLIFIENIRQQISIFKQKQFRYQNSNIMGLKKQIGNLKSVVGQLQKKFHNAQTALKVSRCSSINSKKYYDSTKKQNSCLFEDYEQTYDDVDSLGEDQFFHPLQQSTKRYHQKQLNHFNFTQPKKHARTRTAHNESFQNFTSQQQQDDSPNVRRLIKTIKSKELKLPVAIQIDLTGYIRKKNDQRYLVDAEKKGFMLTNVQLNQCKQRGFIIW